LSKGSFHRSSSAATEQLIPANVGFLRQDQGYCAFDFAFWTKRKALRRRSQQRRNAALPPA
ncbi:MAG: hypothetical protein WAK55_26770, partial [Xanthobacteraceae bacterium]